MLQGHAISKSFEATDGRSTVQVLDSISLSVKRGEMIAIVGPSGSGKSTLLYCLSGLLDVSAGRVQLMGKEISHANSGVVAKIRRDHVGFIFQSYNLIPSLSVYENVALPARLARRSVSKRSLLELIAELGLAGREKHLPNQLSGGQQQRVALARVFAAGPDVVFADEPTGALDTQTGKDVLRFLRESADDSKSVVIVTHDLESAAQADRVLVLRDGKIHCELHSPSAAVILEAVAQAGRTTKAKITP